jgi:hypothetical protein
MDQKEAIQHSDLENLRETSSSSTSNRKAYIMATVISVLLIISGVIYFLKFQVETGLTKTNAGSSSSSSHVPNVDRIFFIKSNYNKPNGILARRDKAELYSVLSDGTDLKHYDKAETKMILFDARADWKSKTLIVHGITGGKISIFIQSWDKNELSCPDPAVSNFGQASFFPDGSKIIYVEISLNNSGSVVSNICTSDLKGNDKEILRTIQSEIPIRPQVTPDGKFVFYGVADSNNPSIANLFRIDLKDLTKPDELLHQIKFGLNSTFFLSPKCDEMAEIHNRLALNVLEIYNFETKVHKKIYESKADFYIASWSADGKFVYIVEELNQDYYDINVLIKKINVEKDDHPVTILKNENGENIGTY